MKKIKFTKRTIVALVATLLSLLGCATKVYIDGISVEIAENAEETEIAQQ